MSDELVIKTLIVYQSQKMLILLGQGKVSRLYNPSSRHLNRKKRNQDHT